MIPASAMVRSCARLAAVAAAVALAAAGCSLLPDTRSVTLYRLPSALAQAQRAGAPVLPWALRVDTPHGAAVFDSPRILVLPQGDVLNNYGGARWVDAPTVLARDLLAQAFRLDGRVAAVSTSDSNVYADLELDSDLRKFQSEYRDGKPYAVIAMEVRLVQNATRRVLASRGFEAAQPAGDAQVPAVVAAFGQAGDALAAQVVQWTVEAAPR